MLILGINSVYHDSSACILRDGELLGFHEEERYSRVKHAKVARIDNPHELPERAIEQCLRDASLAMHRPVSLKDIDHIGYTFDPGLRLRMGEITEKNYPVSEGFGSVAGERLFHDLIRGIPAEVARRGFFGRFHFLPHHACHAASCYNVSPFDEAAVLVVDGIGEFETTSLYRGTGSRLERIDSLAYPHSLGFLWEKISQFLGFSAYDASKVMGLAAFGDAAPALHALRRVVETGERGSFCVDDRITRFRSSDFTELSAVFGLPKRDRPMSLLGGEDAGYLNVAAALQHVTEEILLGLAGRLREETQSRHLCLAGGVALNCAANGKLWAGGLFEDIYIQPAANDAGTALGAAFHLWNQTLGNPRGFRMENAFHGRNYISAGWNMPEDAASFDWRRANDVAEETAGLLAEGKLVAWYQGANEIGPRALGNRSILADPRQKHVRDLINAKIKYREMYRPLCPSVLEEEFESWFGTAGSVASENMLMAHRLRKGRELVPAVVHADGTCRAQKVRRNRNPRFHALISHFHRLTGVPMLLNTSFNISEPIVSSPADALETFRRSGLDALVIDDMIVTRRPSESVRSGQGGAGHA